eukprot:m.87364 g.87364  ORF g.87364 m.87364 type:complete len:554 (-) comp13104_c0_seq4:1331-2992(-)
MDISQNLPVEQIVDGVNQNFAGYSTEISNIVTWISACTSIPNGPIGLVVHGPSGTGKTSIISAILTQAQKLGCVNGSIVDAVAIYREQDIFASLDAIFSAVRGKDKPYVLIIDQLEILCPASHSGQRVGLVEHQLTQHFLECIDKLQDESSTQENPKGVFVIGITPNMEQVDKAIFRSGRLSINIRIPVPSPSQRREILLKLLKDTGMEACINIAPVDLVEALVKRTPGFVAADLKYLCKQAALIAASKTTELNHQDHLDLTKSSYGMVLSLDAFDEALLHVSPSTLTGFGSKNIRMANLSALVGLGEIPDTIIAACKLSLGGRVTSRSLSLPILPKGFVIHGPSGVGKSMLAVSVAHELDVNIIPVQPTSIRGKVVGESEQAIRKVFQIANDSQPCILLFDGLESFAGASQGGDNTSEAEMRLISSLTSEIDRVLQRPQDKVLIVATANDLLSVHPSILRPGRLDQHFEIPIPNKTCRTQILRSKLEAMPAATHLLGMDEMETLVSDMDNFTGAQIESSLREAAMIALREDINSATLEIRHIVQAVAAQNYQ